MASVHLCGPQVASVAMAKPASLDGLRVPPQPSLAVSRGRRGSRGLVVRAATVVSPKVTDDCVTICCCRFAQWVRLLVLEAS